MYSKDNSWSLYKLGDIVKNRKGYTLKVIKTGIYTPGIGYLYPVLVENIKTKEQYSVSCIGYWEAYYDSDGDDLDIVKLLHRDILIMIDNIHYTIEDLKYKFKYKGIARKA